MTVSDRLIPFSAGVAESAKPIHFVRQDKNEDLSVAPEPLQALAAANGFKGDAGAKLADESAMLLGVGDGNDRMILAAAANAPAGVYQLAKPPKGADAIVAAYAWLYGGYRFDRYKSTSAPEATLMAPEGVDVEQVRAIGENGELIRDLVNTPAGDLDPAGLESAARALAETHKASIDVLIGEQLLEHNFPMVHAVGRAAECPPRLIDLRWGREDAPRVTLVGKGVTFDSGGLNIKTGGGMTLMKKDMGGAAHALGLAGMLAASGVDIRLRVLIPAVENAISGNAFRPGDILSSRKGSTVEIGNTDAEGRLILADALSLAMEEEPDLLVSLATLTGAARVALGQEVVPFYTNDDAIADTLQAASNSIADPIWRMPLWRNYMGMLTSRVADINHISGTSFGGSIIAGLFLQHFVGTKAPWVHFDMYAWRQRAAPGRPVGGEVQAVRALLKMITERFG